MDGNTWGYSPLLAHTLSRKAELLDRDHLKVEKIGGPGFGGLHLKSDGELLFSKLSPEDQQRVEQLFKNPQYAFPPPGKSETIPSGGPSQPFFYIITRGTEKIKVPDNHEVPDDVKNRVTDRLE
jgi:hypothetical protein